MCLGGGGSPKVKAPKPAPLPPPLPAPPPPGPAAAPPRPVLDMNDRPDIRIGAVKKAKQDARQARTATGEKRVSTLTIGDSQGMSL
tara:strand:+ start:425 stop:682 length:258 start_codon:yes stop_codon:yes gene_type:complete